MFRAVRLPVPAAELGVGSVAVAPAVRDRLGDLVASLSIVLDKPFAVSDFPIIGELVGDVEHSGPKRTPLYSLSCKTALSTRFTETRQAATHSSTDSEMSMADYTSPFDPGRATLLQRHEDFMS